MGKTKWEKLLLISGAAVLTMLVLLLGLLAFKYTKNHTFSDGTYVADLNISGKSSDEAKHLLNSLKEEYLQKELTFTLKGASQNIKIADLPVEIQVDETIDLISTLNTDELSLIEFLFPKSPPRDLPLITRVNEDKLISQLEEQFNVSDIRAISANYYFSEDETLEISDELSGYVIDYPNFKLKLLSAVQDLQSTSLDLELTEEQAIITAEQLEAEKPEMLEKLTNNFALVDPIYSDDWYIELIDYQDWVTFQAEENRIKIKINREPLDAYIDEEISKWLDLSPENVKIYSDENEEIQIEGKGSDGMEIMRDLLLSSIELAVENKAESLVIPIRKITPEVEVSEDLQKLGIRERISVGHTSYYGSPGNRIHNIKMGAARFNGTLIAPDEEFSFNTTLGPVNGATGYRKELVIKKEGTKPEYGGGLCQVSTTMYRTILMGGFQTTARRPHSYAVSYYSQVMGHGLDATIYLGGQDLKFVNDTDKHLLVQAYVQDDYELYIVFYGTADGRTVELEGPYLSNYHSPGATQYIDTPSMSVGKRKQVERSHTGFNALWYRYITDRDGNTKKETINSAYRAIPAKILVGTGQVN